MSLSIYIFKGEHKNKGEELLRNALKTYVEEKREKSVNFECIDFAKASLGRTQSGKPFLEGYPVHFSISHTGDIWSCLISTENVGLDIQKMRDLDFNKLANRFFLDEEIKFVRDFGRDGFFDIWVRKEACIKYLGTGIRDIRAFSVVENSKLVDEISLKDMGSNIEGEISLKDMGSNIEDEAAGKYSACFIKAFELAHDIKGACCFGMRGVDLWIKELS